MKERNSDSKVHCPRILAELELFRKMVLDDNKSSMKEVEVKEKEIEHKSGKMKVLEYAFDDAKEINDSVIDKLSKIMFTVANAYPYIFDAICGILTNQEAISRKYKREIVQFDDIPESIFYMIDVPFSEFWEWALDGKIEQKDRVVQDLIKLAATPPNELQKYIPISQNYCAKVAPIQIVLIRKNEETISKGKLKRLHNLTIRKTNKGSQDEKTESLLSEKLPIERIQIHVLKSLFQDLMIGDYGEKWFLTPKAFQAKIVDFRPKYIEKLSRDMEEAKSNGEKEKYEKFKRTIEIFPSPMVFRRAYLYFGIHKSSNKSAKKMNFIATDLFSHINPSYLNKNSYGKLYVIGGMKSVCECMDMWHNCCSKLGRYI